MKSIDVNGVTINVDVRGSGPWITFSHALAGDLSLWDAQIDALATHFSILRYDIRGHGRSSAPPAPYALADLAQDVIGLWNALGIERSHVVGLSLGGMIAQQLALSAPQRIDRLVLCSTASGYAANRDAIARLWEQRIAQVEAQGMAAVADATLARWFTEPFLHSQHRRMTEIAQVISATSLTGYAACGRMLADVEMTSALAAIRNPTLVMVGSEDAGTTPAIAEVLAAAIPAARLEVFPQASHCLQIEQSVLFNSMLNAFFSA